MKALAANCRESISAKGVADKELPRKNTQSSPRQYIGYPFVEMTKAEQIQQLKRRIEECKDGENIKYFTPAYPTEPDSMSNGKYTCPPIGVLLLQEPDNSVDLSGTTSSVLTPVPFLITRSLEASVAPDATDYPSTGLRCITLSGQSNADTPTSGKKDLTSMRTPEKYSEKLNSRLQHGYTGSSGRQKRFVFSLIDY